jgi:hypothetical protein
MKILFSYLMAVVIFQVGTTEHRVQTVGSIPQGHPGGRVSAQENRYSDSYVCKDGKIHFSASTVLAHIDATSKSTVCVLNTETKKIYAQVAMRSFLFWNREMQQDFNECYIETDRFPFAILEMNIVDNYDFTKDGDYQVTLKGTFELRGVKREKEIKGTLVIKNGQPFSATAKFEVKPGDYNIIIPNIVIEKIAPLATVDVNLTFERYVQALK